MKIDLIRDTYTDKSTTGKIFVDGVFTCYSLEDQDRRLEQNPGAKIKGETAIPLGQYRVIRNMSARFKKMLPLLLDVQGFEGVRIHSGNSPADTEGCILPGITRARDWVGDSRSAFMVLDKKISDALSRGEEVTMTVKRSLVSR